MNNPPSMPIPHVLKPLPTNPVEMDQLKPEINQFLWKVLPGKTTLHEAELIACEIFLLLEKHFEK